MYYIQITFSLFSSIVVGIIFDNSIRILLHVVYYEYCINISHCGRNYVHIISTFSLSVVLVIYFNYITLITFINYTFLIFFFN